MQITALEMRFVIKIGTKTRIDRIRNTILSRNMKIRELEEKKEASQYSHIHEKIDDDNIVR